MSEDFPGLRIDPEEEHRINHPREDLWIEADVGVEYSDVGREEEASLLEKLQNAPWEEVVAGDSSS